MREDLVSNILRFSGQNGFHELNARLDERRYLIFAKEIPTGIKLNIFEAENDVLRILQDYPRIAPYAFSVPFTSQQYPLDTDELFLAQRQEKTELIDELYSRINDALLHTFS